MENATPSLRRYARPEVTLRPELEPDRLIRPGELATLLSVSVQTVYRLVAAGRIPKPRRLSHRVAGWRAAAILPFVRGEDSQGENSQGDVA